MRFSLQILEVSVGSVWLHVASLLLLPLLYWFAFVLSAFVSLYAYSHSHTSEQCILSSSFILTLQVPLLLFSSLCNSICCMCHYCIVVFTSSLNGIEYIVGFMLLTSTWTYSKFIFLPVLPSVDSNSMKFDAAIGGRWQAPELLIHRLFVGGLLGNVLFDAGCRGRPVRLCQVLGKSWFTDLWTLQDRGNDGVGWIILTSEVKTYYVSFHPEEAETTMGTQTLNVEPVLSHHSPVGMPHVWAQFLRLEAFVVDAISTVGQRHSNFWSQPSLAQCGLQRMCPCFHLPRLVWGLEDSLVANFDKT